MISNWPKKPWYDLRVADYKSKITENTDWRIQFVFLYFRLLDYYELIT